MTYRGRGPLAVIGLSPVSNDDQTSAVASWLADELGDFTGQIRERDGTFLLEVTAKGAWIMTPR